MKWAVGILFAAVSLRALPAFAMDLSKVSFNGYIDVEYTSADNAEGNYNSSFHQHHLSFLLDVPVTDKLSAFTHIEFDHGTNLNTTNIGQAAVTQGGGDLIVENAFIRYAESNAIQFRIGRMLTPFGYYNEIHDATPAIISVTIPKSISGMETRGGVPMFPQWTTGANMLGTIPIGSSALEYTVYIGNGENPYGYNDSEVDANANKAVGARVNFQATEHIQVGASFYNGDRASQSTIISPIKNMPHTTGGLLLALNSQRLFFLSEYAASQVDGHGASAAYGQFTYLLNKRFSPYCRLEYSEPNDSISDNAWTEFIAGLNMRPIDSQNIILKAEFSQNSRGKNNNAVLNDLMYKELRLAVTLYF